MKGAYLLVLRLARGQRIRIGKKGTFTFPAGFYVYVGSHMKDMDSRIARHARRAGDDKTLKWHIDFLRERAGLVAAIKVPSRTKDECRLSRRVGAHGELIVPGFGSSDCACPTHLWHFRTDPSRSLKAF